CIQRAFRRLCDRTAGRAVMAFVAFAAASGLWVLLAFGPAERGGLPLPGAEGPLEFLLKTGNFPFKLFNALSLAEQQRHQFGLFQTGQRFFKDMSFFGAHPQKVRNSKESSK